MVQEAQRRMSFVWERTTGRGGDIHRVSFFSFKSILHKFSIPNPPPSLPEEGDRAKKQWKNEFSKQRKISRIEKTLDEKPPFFFLKKKITKPMTRIGFLWRGNLRAWLTLDTSLERKKKTNKKKTHDTEIEKFQKKDHQFSFHFTTTPPLPKPPTLFPPPIFPFGKFSTYLPIFPSQSRISRSGPPLCPCYAKSRE